MADTVLIADDHPIFRHGLREVIHSDGHFRLVAEAGSGREALFLLRRHRPGLAVLDISMPEGDGLDVLAQIMRWPDAPRCIMLTMYDDPGYFQLAMELGALGYLLKENAAVELINCLRVVSQGRRYLGTGLDWQSDSEGQIEILDVVNLLSPAERRVLRLVGQYKSSREIAELLNISPRTVENHRAHMVRKLNIKGPHALLHFALRNRDRIK